MKLLSIAIACGVWGIAVFLATRGRETKGLWLLTTGFAIAATQIGIVIVWLMPYTL